MASTDSKRKWTIYDIANEAGVSAKTVSQVLNDKDGVAEETRARIRAIMDRVGYQPHVGARALRGGTHGVGVTLPVSLDIIPLSQDLFMHLFARLLENFGACGEFVTFDINPFDQSSGEDYARGLWQNMYRACIVMGPLADGDTTVRRIHERGDPYLTMSRLDTLPECSCAAVDYELGTYLSAKHLIAKGHTRIALLKAFTGFQAGTERRRGYMRALEEAGIEPDEELIRNVSFSTRNLAQSAEALLKDHSVTALVDSTGLEDRQGLREAARRAGRVTGKDFEVLPWTYSEDGAVLHEACAQMWLPAREAGEAGVDEFTKWVYGKSQGPVNIVRDPVLVEPVPSVEQFEPRKLFDRPTS